MIGPDTASCAANLASACRAESPWLATPLMFGIHMGSTASPLPYLTQDVAGFLLMRGPWAWIGAGVWGMSWPVGMTWNSSNVPVPRPPIMDTDFGYPVDPYCREVASNVFARQWSLANVTLDCNTWTADITMTKQ